MVCVLLLVLGCLNYQNADYVAYEYQFDNFDLHPNYYGDSIGYQVLVMGGRAMGLSFLVFRGSLVLISILLIWSTLVSLEGHSSAVTIALLTYAIFPFFYDVVQFRFMLASSILLYGLSKLYYGKKAVFFLFLTLASSIHYSLIYGVVFLLVDIDVRRLKMASLFITLAITTACFCGVLPDLLSLFLTPERAESYINKRQGIGAFIACFIVIALPLFVGSLRRTRKVGGRAGFSALRSNDGLGVFCEKIGWLCVPLCGVLILDVSTGFRLIRYLLVIFYLYFYKIAFSKGVVVQERQVIFLLSVFFMVGILLFGMSMHTFQTTYGAVISNNILFDVLQNMRLF